MNMYTRIRREAAKILRQNDRCWFGNVVYDAFNVKLESCGNKIKRTPTTESNDKYLREFSSFVGERMDESRLNFGSRVAVY